MVTKLMGSITFRDFIIRRWGLCDESDPEYEPSLFKSISVQEKNAIKENILQVLISAPTEIMYAHASYRTL